MLKTAFTLIELLVVIAIIGILSSLIVVSMGGITEKANIAKTQVFSNSLKNSIMLDLVSEWKLDDNLDDIWGINSDGSIVGATTLNNGCVRDSCLSFDGDDYLQIGNNSSLNFSNDYTIEMFVYNNPSSSTYSTLFNRGSQAQGVGFFWTYAHGIDKKDIYYQYHNGTTYTNTSFLNCLPKDKWTHLAFSFNNNDKSLKLYVNGVLFPGTRTLTNALPVNSGTLYFGTYRIIAGHYFKGRLDEIRWYHTVVPAYLIKEHYYSALNNLWALGEITKKEYSNLIYDRD